MEFDELVKISDYISIHTPLLAGDASLFNADVFGKMKPRRVSGEYCARSHRG